MGLRLIVRSSLLSLSLLVAFSAFPQSSLVVSQKEVWRIDPVGNIERLDYDFGGPVLQASMRGTTGPLVSPDQKRIAFTRNNDLWVLNLATMSATQATKVGRPYTNQLASVFVLLTAWSPDSRTILYHVEQGEAEDPDSAGPERKLRKAPYGDHIYDLESQNSVPTFVPGEFLAWLADGDFLVKNEQAQLMRLHPGKRTGSPVTVEAGDYGQVAAKSDSKQILASRGAEIVLIDLADGKTSTLAKGTWAEFQWPAFSPSGNHLSYLRQYPLSTRGRYGQEILVDGVPIYRLDKDFSYYWIDDETLALIVFGQNGMSERSWILVDRETGKEKVSKAVLAGRH